MKSWIGKIAHSFRWRMTLLFGVLIVGLFTGYDWMIQRRLGMEIRNRTEEFLRHQMAIRSLVLLDPLGQGGRGMRRNSRRNEALMAVAWQNGNWHEDDTAWPEELRERVRNAFSKTRKLPEAKIFEEDQIPRSGWDQPTPPGPPPRMIERELFKARFVEIEADGSHWVVGALRFANGIIYAADTLDQERAALDGLRRWRVRLMPLLLLVALGLGWILVTRALRPVKDLTTTMESLTERDLSRRLSVARTASEFRPLIEVFNKMLQRLERSFQQASRFSSDAAHELRTPLTILQGELESLCAAEPTGSSAQRSYNSLLDEVVRMRMMTDRLLLLARADAGRLLGRRESVEVGDVVAEVFEDMEAVAPDISVTMDLTPATVSGDRELITRALANLASNAVKYNRPEGSISVFMTCPEKMCRVEVASTGETIPPDLQPHLFDRFFRVDSARSREKDGVGLGLSLGREIARAHGGDLTLVESRNGRTVFRLEIPLSGES